MHITENNSVVQRSVHKYPLQESSSWNLLPTLNIKLPEKLSCVSVCRCSLLSGQGVPPALGKVTGKWLVRFETKDAARGVTEVRDWGALWEKGGKFLTPTLVFGCCAPSFSTASFLKLTANYDIFILASPDKTYLLPFLFRREGPHLPPRMAQGHLWCFLPQKSLGPSQIKDKSCDFITL